jgi:hypothetical protein
MSKDISDNLPNDPNFIINDINDETQIKFYNTINEIIKNPAYTETLYSIKWNTYYYKKYKAENGLLYFIMGICVLIIVLNLIKKKFPYFDDISYSVIIGIILAYSFIHILYILWSITYKDKFNFDENDYSFDTEPNYGTDLSNNNSNSNSVSCSKTTVTDSVTDNSVFSINDLII